MELLIKGSTELNKMFMALQRTASGLRRDFGEVENLQQSLRSARDFVHKAANRIEESILNEKIWVTMQIFSVIAVFSASHLRQKIIFLHDPQNCFWISVNPAFFKPNTHSSVPISAFGTRLTFPDLFCKIQIFCRQLHSADKSVITASGNPEKAAHFTDSVFFSVAVDNPIL